MYTNRKIPGTSPPRVFDGINTSDINKFINMDIYSDIQKSVESGRRR